MKNFSKKISSIIKTLSKKHLLFSKENLVDKNIFLKKSCQQKTFLKTSYQLPNFLKQILLFTIETLVGKNFFKKILSISLFSKENLADNILS